MWGDVVTEGEVGPGPLSLPVLHKLSPPSRAIDTLNCPPLSDDLIFEATHAGPQNRSKTSCTEIESWRRIGAPSCPPFRCRALWPASLL